MKKLLISTFILLAGTLCFAQSSYPTSDSVHIFWHSGIKPAFSDYQGRPTPEAEAIMKKYDFSATASLGIWSVLDIPKKKKDRYKKFEKVYFAPAFEKATSYAKTNDSLQIEMQNLYFDICEIWARWARKELNTFQDSSKATGTLSIFYTTVEKQMDENRIAMYKLYFKDVFIDKKEGAFAKWREGIDKILADTKMWATTPEECFRFISNKPIEDGYIKAPFVMSPIEN